MSMEEELSFELLRRYYGYDHVRDAQSDEPRESLDPVISIDRSHGCFTPYELCDGTYHAPSSYRQEEAFPQQPAQLYDTSSLGQHFDFHRAEQEGLVAPPSLPAVRAGRQPSFPARDDGAHSQRIDSAARSFDRNADPRSEQSTTVHAEPMPGRRVQLVPVTTLRKSSWMS